MKCVAHVAAVLCAVVAPPRGERGLKCAVPPALRLLYLVAPPRGERGLKCLIRLLLFVQCHRRSPSWGAWIEMLKNSSRSKQRMVAPPRGERGLKSPCRRPVGIRRAVAPPRGERGLKCLSSVKKLLRYGRSPSWGAWIGIISGDTVTIGSLTVAPPRGERGLKLQPPRPLRQSPPRRSPSWGAWIEIACLARLNVAVMSLPLVGSVD